MLAQLNLLDSHDVSRFLTECGGDEVRMRQAVVFQMTFPGMPCVFYGDELGLTGASEPEYRQAMPWGRDHPLRTLYWELIALRRGHPALRRGRFRVEVAQSDQLAYTLEDASERVSVLFNRAGAPVDARPWLDAAAQRRWPRAAWNRAGWRRAGISSSGRRSKGAPHGGHHL